MTKEDIRKAVYDLISEIYVCEGMNSTERTLGEIMGIMSMASAMENIAITEESEPPEHDGCVHCKWVLQDETEQPCKNCQHNYADKWEKINE